jgi:PAS domain S-box-containing protein
MSSRPFFSNAADDRRTRLPGCRQEQLSGAGFWDVVWPADRARLADALQRFFATGRNEMAEFRIRAANGRIHWLEERGTLLRDREGRATGMTGVLREISDRKELEKSLAESSDRERRELAHALHDELGQQLTLLE